MAVATPTRGAEEGDARPRRGWPPSAVAAISRLARDSSATAVMEARNPLTEPMLMLVGPSQEGGGLCRPVNAPALESQQERGVVQSDPASASQSSPQGHLAGSPHVSASGMRWGARVGRNECCPRMRTNLTSN
jgi:hypothetical protein